MIVQATCAVQKVEGVTLLLEVEPGVCVCSDPKLWESAQPRIAEALAPGKTLTYGGTQGPDTAMDHNVVHVWHTDFVSKPFVPSDYVEPPEVAEARRIAFDAFDRTTIPRPTPAPYVPGAVPTVEKREWPEHDPAPEHTTRDPFPDGFPIPAAMASLKKKAEAAGWECRIGYSRGKRRAVRIGTYDMVETLGLWAAPHPDSGWRFSALYQRKPQGTASAQKWTWSAMSLWKEGTFPFPYCSVTDLKGFIDVRGSVLPSWFEAIRVREIKKASEQKAAAKARPSTKKEEGN